MLKVSNTCCNTLSINRADVMTISCNTGHSLTLPANVPDLHFTISILTGKSQGCLHCDKLSSWLFQHKANVRLYLSNDFYLRFQLHAQQHIIRPTVFRGKCCQIPQASLQNLAAHCGKIIQIQLLATAFHLRLNTETAAQKLQLLKAGTVLSYVSNIKKENHFFFSKVQ